MAFDVSYDEVIYTGLTCTSCVLYLRRFNGAPEFSQFIQNLRKSNIAHTMHTSVDGKACYIEITTLNSLTRDYKSKQIDFKNTKGQIFVCCRKGKGNLN